MYRCATGQLYNSCHKNDILCSDLMNITVSSGARRTASVLFISTGCGTDVG